LLENAAEITTARRAEKLGSAAGMRCHGCAHSLGNADIAADFHCCSAGAALTAYRQKI